MKTCIVSSSGGHLTEVRALKPAYADHPHFYVLNNRIDLPADMKNCTYFIRHSERDVVTLLNFFEALRIIAREKPTVLLSTGAGPIVPFCLAAKFHGVPTVFVETITRIRSPSLTGRIMYQIADRFFYQWRSLEKNYPGAEFGGPLI